ncbi:hypothetical protein K523DRAFT_422434 [Schizophyllum commune Tattone D]|nr:hypothetical protein K523DRAFT_422434 [Schizophyllum commune Tattone D]
MRASCRGGFEYIGRMTIFSWLSTRTFSSGSAQTSEDALTRLPRPKSVFLHPTDAHQFLPQNIETFLDIMLSGNERVGTKKSNSEAHPVLAWSSSTLWPTLCPSLAQFASATQDLSRSSLLSSHRQPSNAQGPRPSDYRLQRISVCASQQLLYLRGLSLDPLAVSIQAGRPPSFGFPRRLRLLVFGGCRLVRISPSSERAGA